MRNIAKYCYIGTIILFVLIKCWSLSFAGNNSTAAFSTWPDTGQTKCYNNSAVIDCPSTGDFMGQDAQYAGPVRSYTALESDTMVRDNVTGLIWEMKNNIDGTSDYNNSHDADNTYTWCDPNTSTNGNNEGTCGTNDTADFISVLNSGNGFGGHNDWRLPTIKEIATLVDLGRSNPAIDPIFTATTQSPVGYWSSTTDASVLSNYAWTIEFSSGWGSPNNKSSAHYVRAVRGGQPPIQDRYVDNNDGTVTDTVTCLQWQKERMDTKNGVGPDTYTWQEALAVSENLSVAGYSDWRLPNKNELSSLVDYGRIDPAIDPVFGADSFESWSSTSWVGLLTYACYGDFYDGYDMVDDKSSAKYVLAVRGEQCRSFGPFGDVNNNGLVDLADAVLALQVVTGAAPSDTVSTHNEVNDDGKVGLTEAIYALRVCAVINSGETVTTVTSAGQVWMDRNLGSSRAATSPTDSEAYGDLYQWGRGTDGHEKRDSLTSSQTSDNDNPNLDSYPYNDGKFITQSSSTNDWRSPQNNALWQGVSSVNNPCPAGFRLPTFTELETERASWATNDGAGAYGSPLKLVVAGLRFHDIGAVGLDGSNGFYWSSTANGTYSHGWFFGSGGAGMSDYPRADGFSVRCLED